MLYNKNRVKLKIYLALYNLPNKTNLYTAVNLCWKHLGSLKNFKSTKNM